MNLSRFTLAAAFGLAATLSLHADVADGILAIVNDKAITLEQVSEFAAPAMQALQRQYGDQPNVYRQKLAELQQDTLNQLIERQMILHSYETDGYTTLPESVTDQLVKDRIRDRFGDRVTLVKSLQTEGLTMEEFRQQVRDQYIESVMRQINVQREIVVSPYKIQLYYQAHQDDYKQEDQVKLRMIVLNKTGPGDTDTATMAREIQSKINHGADFTQMAALYSQGSQQHQGGDWGWVEKSVLRQDLADTAFGLKVGEVSGVVETPDACYLMTVEGRKSAQFRPLTEVRADIEKILRSDEQARLQRAWIDGLKKKNFVRYLNNSRTEY